MRSDHRQLTRRVEQAGDAENPRVVWDGAGYGVIWEVDVADALSQIYFQRLDEAGLAAGPRQVIAANGHRARLVFNGDAFAVVWAGEGHRVWFRIVDPAGGLGPARVVAHGDEPDISWTGDEYVIVWSADTAQARQLFIGRGTLCP